MVLLNSGDKSHVTLTLDSDILWYNFSNPLHVYILVNLFIPSFWYECKIKFCVNC